MEKKTTKTTAKKRTTAPKKTAPKSVQASGKPSAGTAPTSTADNKMQGIGSDSGELRGGTKQVLIEEVTLENRGGRRPGEEEYPFGQLEPCKKLGDGTLVGQSFFIPDSDVPKAKIAAARKRHKPAGKVFLSRRTTVGDKSGFRVWLEPKA